MWRGVSHSSPEWQSPVESDSQLLAEAQSAEMLGWAAVAERVMCEAALYVASEVDEPRARAELEAEWTTALTNIAAHVVEAAGRLAREAAETATAARQEAVQAVADSRSAQREGAALVSERALLTAEVRQLRAQVEAAAAEAADDAAHRRRRLDSLQEEERTLQARVARLNSERGATAAVLAQVWDFTHAALGDEDADEDTEPLAETARRVCARLLEREEEVTVLKQRITALEASQVARERDAEERLGQPVLQDTSQPSPPPLSPAPQQRTAMLLVEAPRPVYDRLLPNPAVNPVTASLLRVREQVRRLREASHEPVRPPSTASDHVVHSPQPAAPSDASALFPRSVYMHAVTPVRRPAPRESIAREEDSGTTGAALSPVAWRHRMTELQTELRGLRQELGGTR